MRHRYPAALRGFTLAELLIAISITAIIVVLLFRIFGAAAAQWQNADQRIDTFRDARAALLAMGRDLGRANVNGDPEMLKLSDIAGDYAKEAFAIAPAPNSGKSDFCAVGYYLAWDATSKTFTLKRLFKESDSVFTGLAATPPNFTTIYTKTPANEEDAAAYVWDLQFAPGLLANPEPPGTNPSNQWKWIEVRFKSMSVGAARKLRDLPIDESTWSDPSSTIYRNTILPYEQQFVTRIVLQQNQ